MSKTPTLSACQVPLLLVRVSDKNSHSQVFMVEPSVEVLPSRNSASEFRQTISGMEYAIAGAEPTILTCTVSFASQPLILVTTTLYSPEVESGISGVVAPVDQR